MTLADVGLFRELLTMTVAQLFAVVVGYFLAFALMKKRKQDVEKGEEALDARKRKVNAELDKREQRLNERDAALASLEAAREAGKQAAFGTYKREALLKAFEGLRRIANKSDVTWLVHGQADEPTRNLVTEKLTEMRELLDVDPLRS